jgi:hypothetical protein
VGLVSLIDPGLSMTDVAFKPKCLAIHSSMSEYRFDADSRWVRANHESAV